MSISYQSFEELAKREAKEQGYRIREHLRDGGVLVMAPHGGKIEPGTTEIAEAIADHDYSFYSFEGLKADQNSILHIESHLFDEPRALETVENADIVITVHGQVDQRDGFVMVGGLNTRLGLEIKRQLETVGVQTRYPTEGLQGTDSMNICNRGRSKAGVQLEMSRKMRDLLRADKERLQSFARAVRRAVSLYLMREIL